MGGILDFVPRKFLFFPQNADSVGRKLFSFPWNFVFFPCNFFFVRWNFYFLGRCFIISRDFFTKVRNFPLKDGKFRKKKADFLQKHHEVAKFKSAENRLFPTNSFGVANGVLN